MSRELRAGIGISDGVVQSVVLEFNPDGVQVRYLSELTCNDGTDAWIADAVADVKRGGFGKVSNIFVVLDNKSVFLHAFPLDTALPKPEQNDHLHWELSNYLVGFKPQEYIIDIHVLKTRSREQISEVLSVTVRRDLLSSIQETLARMRTDLHSADIQHFGAQHSLLSMYPELRAKTVLLAGCSKERVDGGTIMNGRLAGYRYAPISAHEQYLSFLREAMKSTSASHVAAYGPEVTPELLEELRTGLEAEVLVLNPFRKLGVSPSFRDFEKFIGREHHFAACVGCALRRE